MISKLKSTGTRFVDGSLTARERVVWLDIYTRTERDLVARGILAPDRTHSHLVRLRHWINRRVRRGIS